MFTVFFTFFLVHREREAERKAAEKLKKGSVRERLRVQALEREKERERAALQ